MPPATLSLRRRLAAALPLLVAAAFLFVLSLTASSDDYREAAVSTHSTHPAQPHIQQWTTTGGGDRIDVLSGASERVEVEGKGRKARVGLAGAKQKVIVTKNDEGDELSFTVQHEQQPRVRLPLSTKNRFSLTAHSHDRFYPRLRHTAERVVTYIGDFLLDLIGFDAEEEWFTPGDEETAEGLEGGAGAALAGWSESSVYVERTNALYPSRPSSFGPHLVSSPLRGFLFPITSLVSSSDSYACSSTSPTTLPTKKGDVPEDWIALVQRGKCPFSDKVRVAQEWGAKGVVFGDMEESEGGIGGGKGLLTPWSPDDTADIQIPSLFVSRASYLSLLRAWQDEQELAQHQNDTSPRSQPKMEDGETQTDLVREGDGEKEKPLVGLEVVLSKEEVFAWPLLDLLFLLLFLPSLLTLVTVFTQRVRVARAAKAERAPKEAVARLPVFRWGDTEKGAAGSPAAREDEERDVGSHAASEGTPLLPHSDDVDASQPTPLTPSLLQRALAYLPTSFTRHLPTHFAPLPPASTAYPRIFSRPSRRFPTLVECPFCLSDFERGDLVMELPCGHVFHEEEVVGWLEGQRGVCPVCRMSVVSQPTTTSSSSEVTDSSSTAAADPASSATPIAPPQPINADGAAILVNYLRPPYHSTSAPFEPPVQRTYAASPVASSSSVPIEGVLGQTREREERDGGEEEVKEAGEEGK